MELSCAVGQTNDLGSSVRGAFFASFGKVAPFFVFTT